LAVTLAVVAVVTTFAAPSLVAAWRAATLRAAAEELVTALNLGRQLAISRNTPVCIAAVGPEVRFEGTSAGVCSGVGLPGAVPVRLASGLTVRAGRRLALLRSWSLEDWSGARLRAGRAVEADGTIVNAARYRRETVVADHAGRECASSMPSTVACKRVRVTVSYRPVSGGGGPAEERRVDLVTVLVSRAVTPTS